MAFIAWRKWGATLGLKIKRGRWGRKLPPESSGTQIAALTRDPSGTHALFACLTTKGAGVFPRGRAIAPLAPVWLQAVRLLHLQNFSTV